MVLAAAAEALTLSPWAVVVLRFWRPALFPASVTMNLQQPGWSLERAAAGRGRLDTADIEQVSDPRLQQQQQQQQQLHPEVLVQRMRLVSHPVKVQALLQPCAAAAWQCATELWRCGGLAII